MVFKTLIVGVIAVVLVSAVIIGIGGRPPHRLTIAAGAQGGAYHAFAERLRDVLAARGFTLDILESAGSVDNVGAIQHGQADIGLVQSGTDPRQISDEAMGIDDDLRAMHGRRGRGS